MRTLERRPLEADRRTWLGRIIAATKSGYLADHPTHVVVFNAGICRLCEGLPELLWEGDLDLTVDEPHLVAHVETVQEAIFVLHEPDRPDNFHGARWEALSRAVVAFDATGVAHYEPRKIVRDGDGRLKRNMATIELDALQWQVAVLSRRCERLDALLSRAIEQGIITAEERDRALWFEQEME